MKSPYKALKKKFPFLTPEEYKNLEVAEVPKKTKTAAKKPKKQ